MIGQDLQALRVAVKLHPLVHVEDRAAGHRGGPQDGHQRDVALLLEPLQVPADAGHLEPGRHAAGHHQVLAGAEEIPRQRRGDAADVLRVEHVHRAAQRPGAGGALVQVRPGAGGEHRAGVIEDPVSDDPRFPGALGGHDEHLVLHPRVRAAEPLAAAEPHRVVRRPGPHAVPEPETGPGPAAVADRGVAGPAEPQLADRGEARPRVQAQADPPPDGPDPVT